MGNLICKICSNEEGNVSFIAKELMFGTQDKFEYFECKKCGCLQINSIPNYLSKYYPQKSYYSFKGISPPIIHKYFRNLRFFLRKKRSNYLIFRKDYLGKLIYLLSDKYFENKICWDWFKKGEVYTESKILDVGCGSGELLNFLYSQGFNNLTGIDPYIKNNDIKIGINNNPKIFKKTIDQLQGDFDFIMLHHSFEHMEDPIFIMKHINRLVKNKHYVLIRTPLADSYAWEKYRTNWVQLDAPRHLFIHTIKSIKKICDLTGFFIDEIVYDSTSFQFTGSELYLKNITLEFAWTKKNGTNSFFSDEELKTYHKFSIDLNKCNKGDQACFYLKKIN